MRLGIDASNIRAGGGITHLVELLRAAPAGLEGFREIVVWSGRATLDRIADRPWLVKSYQTALDQSLPRRALWQRFALSDLARAMQCDALFVPGGSYAGNFRPVVTMSRNLLPFEWREMARYGLSMLTLKWWLLRQTQSATFRRVNGMIFLTAYARQTVEKVTGTLGGKLSIVPHGIDERFLCAPRQQKPLAEYSFDRPFRLIYVSIVDAYKHQWNVAEAVSMLRGHGYPICLDLIGPAYGPALRRLQKVLQRVDPTHSFIRYLGPIPYDHLHRSYSSADLCVFASSCENMPNILLEGMASGLPVVCSNRGPMPEVLGDAGAFFDPERPDEIRSAIETMLESPELRSTKAAAASRKVAAFSWKRCAQETLKFLAEVTREFHARNGALMVARER